MRAAAEEQRLIDLLRAEELEEAAAATAAARRAQKARLQQQMAEANQRQIELKVRTRASTSALQRAAFPDS